MTDKKLVEIATKYSLDYDKKYSEEFTLVDMIRRPKEFVDGSIEDMLNMIKKKAYRDGYIDAYKAGSQDKMTWQDYDAGEDCYEDTHEGKWVKRDNIVEWHNIEENPNDLPYDNQIKICQTKLGEQLCACYDREVGCWKTTTNNFENFIPSGIIVVWTEIKPFTKEMYYDTV